MALPKPPPYSADLISRCISVQSDDSLCNGALWSSGDVTGSCGDACSFIMRKGGVGEPPFLDEGRLVDEMQKLLARRSRGTVTY